jgi:hypothetical protein
LAMSDHAAIRCNVSPAERFHDFSVEFAEFARIVFFCREYRRSSP